MNKLKQGLFYLSIVGMGLTFTACSEDEGGGTPLTGAYFERTASSYIEGDGNATHEIAVLGFKGSESDIEFSFAGTATEGEDYDVVGFSNGVLTLTLLDDNLFENNETIRIQIVDAKGGVGRTRFHLVNLSSPECTDNVGLDVSYFAGHWDALEDYGGGSTYGPYEIELIQDSEDPNVFHFDNLYDSGCDAYMVFDMEAGTVYFPDQAPCGVDLTNSSGTFNIDLCNQSTLTINLNFDGGDWIYRFTKL
jgi:hypothetical protein